METRTERKGANGPLDAGGALDPADARGGEARRVLIVDDDAVVLARPVNLEAERVHVLEAADGLAALEPRLPRLDHPRERRARLAAGNRHERRRPPAHTAPAATNGPPGPLQWLARSRAQQEMTGTGREAGCA